MASISRTGRWPVMSRSTLAFVSVLLAVASSGHPPIASVGSPQHPAFDDPVNARVHAAYENLPIAFEANEGQTDEPVRILSRGKSYNQFLTPTEAVFSLTKPPARHVQTDSTSRASRDLRGARSSAAVIRMKIAGGASLPEQITGLEPLAGTSNYFTRADPSQWRADIHSYAKVQYRHVYPGIDLVFHGARRQLEYDFIVAPGADPGRIRLHFDGVTDREFADDGALILRNDQWELREKSRISIRNRRAAERASPVDLSSTRTGMSAFTSKPTIDSDP